MSYICQPPHCQHRPMENGHVYYLTSSVIVSFSLMDAHITNNPNPSDGISDGCLILSLISSLLAQGEDLGFNATTMHQQNPNYRPFRQHLWSRWSLTQGRGRGGCKTPVSATLAGAQIYDCNTLTRYLVVIVHQYPDLVYNAVKP